MIVIRRQINFSNLKCFQMSIRHQHPYKIKENNSHDLAKLLLKNLIYHKKGILVLNKPYGISFARDSIEKGDVSSDNLYQILKKDLECEELIPAKVPERYASGAALFCTTKSALNNVNKCLKSMRGTKQPAELYECVVIGQPSREEGKFEGGITIEKSPDGKHKGVTLIKECSVNRVRKGEIKPVVLYHSTLSLGDYASRIVISVTRTRWHSVRVYAAKELVSPILGDRIFGRYVKKVLGKPVLINNFSPVAEQPQKLSSDLLSKLDLSSRKDIDIPLHLHLTRIQLKGFQGIEDIEFIAQPPDHFLWTCEVLNLNKVSEFTESELKI